MDNWKSDAFNFHLKTNDIDVHTPNINLGCRKLGISEALSSSWLDAISRSFLPASAFLVAFTTKITNARTNLNFECI